MSLSTRAEDQFDELIRTIGGEIDFYKAKSPYSTVPVPEAWLPFLAQIALLWGRFELSFEEFFDRMISANREEPPKWRRLKFGQKEKLFRDAAAVCFKSCPSVISELEKIIEDATNLQIVRNVLLHGRIGFEFKHRADGAREAVIHARGMHNKQDIEEEFNRDRLETLFYDLAHLSGRMGCFNSAGTMLLGYPGRVLALRDRHFLQDFLDKHRPRHTTVPKLQLPPESSRG